MAKHATTVRLSAEGRRGWQRMKKKSGANFTALVEAIGVLLDQGRNPLSDEVIDLARGVQAERDDRSAT